LSALRKRRGVWESSSRLRRLVRSRSNCFKKLLKPSSYAGYLFHVLIVSRLSVSVVFALVFPISHHRWHSQTSRLYNEGPDTRCNHVPNSPYQLHLVSILKLLSAILKGKTRLTATLAEVESNSASAVLCVTIPGIEQKKKKCCAKKCSKCCTLCPGLHIVFKRQSLN